MEKRWTESPATAGLSAILRAMHNDATQTVLDDMRQNGETILLLTWERDTEINAVHGMMITMRSPQQYVLSDVSVRSRFGGGREAEYGRETIYSSIDDAIRNARF